MSDNMQDIADDRLDEHLWGYLEPLSKSLCRIDFWRIQPSYRFGRDAETNLITLPAAKMSGDHAVFMWDGNDAPGGVTVKDLSTNGTFVNGVKIGRGTTRILHDGNEIAFATPFPLPDNELEDYRFIYRHVLTKASLTKFDLEYEMSDRLGAGSFGEVRRCLHRATGEYFAVKILRPVKAAIGTTRQAKRDRYAAGEIGAMQELKHRNICKLFKAFFERDMTLHLVLELVDGGDMLTYINKTEMGIEELPAKDIMYQICDAMSYIHGKGITHRDLKPENILLTSDNPPLVKIADFGVAKIVDSMSKLKSLCGSPHYLAPEVFAKNVNGYDDLVDSWSVGVTLFSMLTRSSPYPHHIAQNYTSLLASANERNIDWDSLNNPNFKNPLSDEVKNFLKMLLQNNPKHRMSLTSSMKHPWLRDYEPLHGPAFIEEMEDSESMVDEFDTDVQHNPKGNRKRAHSKLSPVPEENSEAGSSTVNASGLPTPRRSPRSRKIPRAK